MSRVPIARFAAPLALLVLAACGGGGGSSPGGAAGGSAAFVEPSVALSLPMGAEFSVRLTGLPPHESVVLALDEDGNPATRGDELALARAFLASATGEIQVTVSTDGASEGGHRLFALREGDAEVLATASEEVRLVARGGLTWFASGASEVVRFARPLASGRVALAGQVVGDATYATIAGPVRVQAFGVQDAFTAVLDGSSLVDVAHIGGTYYETLTDLVAAPDGSFSVAGTASGSVPDFGTTTAVSFPVVNWPGTAAGFTATYTADAAFRRGLLTWAHTFVGVPERDVEATAMAHAADGSRWLALRVESNFDVGGLTLYRPGTDGGSVIVRLSDQNRAQTPFVTIEGDARINAVRFAANGDLYVAGTGEGYVRFGSSVPFDVVSGGAFVARYDGSGTCLGVFTRTAGAGRTTAEDLAIGGDGSVFVVGTAYGPSTFAGVEVAPAAGGADGYVIALTSDLAPRWARTWTWWADPQDPNFPQVSCTGVVALPGGGCAVAGSTQDGADVGGVRFGGGLGDQADGAVVRYGPGGGIAWVVVLGGAGPQVVESVAADAEGCLLVPGGTLGTLDLTDRDGTGVHPPVSANSFDGFLLRLDPDGRVR